MSSILRLQHITDVGAPSGNGVDSTQRIKTQYNQLGAHADVVSAGHSPLHVAFTASAVLADQAQKNANKIAKALGIEPIKLPTALNSAPRNSDKSTGNGKEYPIYRLELANEQVHLIYGPEVALWMKFFNNGAVSTIDTIDSIVDENGDPIIPDTAEGSQFRSAEHLPIAHVLQAHNRLDDFSQRSEFTYNDTSEKVLSANQVLVVPPDEYNNARVVADKDTISQILDTNEIYIGEIADKALQVRKSLTLVIPGQLSVWPSSNHFNNPNLGVLNVGTRWKPGTTSTTDNETIEIAQRLTGSVGHIYTIET